MGRPSGLTLFGYFLSTYWKTTLRERLLEATLGVDLLGGLLSFSYHMLVAKNDDRSVRPY